MKNAVSFLTHTKDSAWRYVGNVMDNLIKITEYMVFVATSYYDFCDLSGILSYTSVISSWSDD